MERQIYYHDTDAGGVVYYGNYLKYLEEARTEFFEARGLPVQALLKRGLFYAVRSCNITYHSPARYADRITCNAVVSEITGARIFFTQTVINVTGKLLAEAEVVLVCLNQDFKPQQIPMEVRKLLS